MSPSNKGLLRRITQRLASVFTYPDCPRCGEYHQGYTDSVFGRIEGTDVCRKNEWDRHQYATNWGRGYEQPKNTAPPPGKFLIMVLPYTPDYSEAAAMWSYDKEQWA